MWLWKSHLYVLAGFVALFAFTGDIVADSIADASGEHCISETSGSDPNHETTPCSHCSCAVHMGAVVASASEVNVAAHFQLSIFFLDSKQSAPARLPTAIDHPPQLA